MSRLHNMNLRGGGTGTRLTMKVKSPKTSTARVPAVNGTTGPFSADTLP